MYDYFLVAGFWAAVGGLFGWWVASSRSQTAAFREGFRRGYDTGLLLPLTQGYLPPGCYRTDPPDGR